MTSKMVSLSTTICPDPNSSSDLAHIVTDRLAYLNSVHGSLSLTLANELNTSRQAVKKLRDAERALEPRRKARADVETQIARIEHDQKKEQQQRLAELKVQLQRNEEEDATAEKDIQVLKRKAIRETEQEKWEAIREVSAYVF